MDSVRGRVAVMTQSQRTGILQNMAPSSKTDRRSIDVTGLPEEAIRTLEAQVAAIRQQAQAHAAQPPLWERSHEEWSKALREWVESHPKCDHFVDDSRESIYGDDGR
ncbi:MAG: hypothetical protein K2R98_09110 [Gemmataceae bacterium]|nr:hypothetical protein [Gemmataceae bacterium]